MSEALYHELSFYTLAHPGKDFIHQHLTDAYTAQTATTATQPVAVFFALAGLYLLMERQYSGRQIQQAHLKMAAGKQQIFPVFDLPENRGSITVADVLSVPPGPDRDHKIYEWCAAVWQAYREQHRTIAALTETWYQG